MPPPARWCLLTAGLLWGCKGPATTEPFEPPSLILLVVADTLRADHLGLYGYERDTSAELDAWSAGARVFEAATAQDHWTAPATATMLTGMHPLATDCCVPGPELAIDSPAPTLAEVLGEGGYTTWGLRRSEVVGNVVGLDRGFDRFEYAEGGAPSAQGHSARDLVDRALELLETRDGPTFLYLHFQDPHTAYAPPPPFAGTWSDDYDSDIEGSTGVVQAWEEGSSVPTEAEAARVTALYDEEILYLSSQLGRLLGQVQEPDTVVLFTADHGESLGERGIWEHQDAYQQTLAIPFLLAAPSVSPGQVEVRVQQLDVAPTLVALAGLEAPTAWPGLDLRETPPPRGVLTGTGDVTTYTDPEGIKLLLDRQEVYDLSLDPGELNDLAEPALLARLQAEAEAMAAELSGS